MDWYSWLSKTNLHPTLVYEYGLLFTQNQLQEEDLVYFNHEFLQSIGICVAKHRLDILKLARKELKGSSTGFSRLILAINKTKRLFSKNIGKWGFLQKESSQLPISELTPYRIQWHEMGKKMKSGPLDKRGQEKLMLKSRNLSISGPLEGKMQANWSPIVTRPMYGKGKERLGFYSRSPTVSGPIDGWDLSPKVRYCDKGKIDGDHDGDQSLWSLMFQDLKPT
ncbi:Sterile alpha motif (SAM) domain-containing protein [Forsythia ovata]|uniref:Sterile alpha motif (SAM) domain-containing protein n=1 Tax=Forsythia ovata TaxID=205694 RepID=A0ABD1R2T2_9LAMI